MLSKKLTAQNRDMSGKHRGACAGAPLFTSAPRPARCTVRSSAVGLVLDDRAASPVQRQCVPLRPVPFFDVHFQRVPLGTSPTPRSAQLLPVPVAHPIASPNQRACGEVSQVKTLTVIVDDETGSRTQNWHFATLLRRKVCIFTPALRSHPPNASPSTGTLSLD